MHNINEITTLQIGESVEIHAHEHPGADRSVRLINHANILAQKADITITTEKIDNFTVRVTRTA